jgi:hypothetical protein
MLWCLQQHMQNWLEHMHYLLECTQRSEQRQLQSVLLLPSLLLFHLVVKVRLLSFNFFYVIYFETLQLVV